MILSSWVATATYAPRAQAGLDEPDVGGVDVPLLRVRDLGRLQVRALDDPYVGLEREDP
jgi:hypothetical protein